MSSKRHPPQKNSLMKGKSDLLISCIIPMHDATSDKISQLRKRLSPRISELCIVINDSTHQATRQQILNDSVIILEVPFQVGKQQAFLIALEYVLNKSQCDVVVQTDSRLKQPPEEIEKLLDRLCETDSEMVIADRYTNQFMESQRHRIGITNMISSILSAITPYKIVDASCGTRVYSIKAAAVFRKMHGFGYGLEVEQILMCALHGFAIESIPVTSNTQYSSTNAGKIEDVLYVLISYCSRLGPTKAISNELCRILLMVKRRETFEVDLSVFKGKGIIRWLYKENKGSGIVGGYTSQIPIDSYSLYNVES
jgi:hypothetical protein